MKRPSAQSLVSYGFKVHPSLPEERFARPFVTLDPGVRVPDIPLFTEEQIDARVAWWKFSIDQLAEGAKRALRIEIERATAAK